MDLAELPELLGKLGLGGAGWAIAFILYRETRELRARERERVEKDIGSRLRMTEAVNKLRDAIVSLRDEIRRE